MTGFWIALGVCVACLVAGLALAAARGLGAWRQVKATRAVVGPELERINRTTAEIEVQLAAASASQERLGAALERLSASRARLQVQLDAIAEAQGVFRRLLPFLPK